MGPAQLIQYKYLNLIHLCARAGSRWCWFITRTDTDLSNVCLAPGPRPPGHNLVTLVNSRNNKYLQLDAIKHQILITLACWRKINWIFLLHWTVVLLAGDYLDEGRLLVLLPVLVTSSQGENYLFAIPVNLNADYFIYWAL